MLPTPHGWTRNAKKLGYCSYNYVWAMFAVFPHWGDVALKSVCALEENSRVQGLLLRQAVRRACPLPPGAAINLLAAQRSLAPETAADGMLAVNEAWERGLLRPGVADVSLLDWRTAPPANVASFAAVLDAIARDGLLSVIWPIVDALIEASIKAPRLFAGTAELTDLIHTFLPEVKFAIELGKTDVSALDLPGIRALANRGGTSRAVRVAASVVGLLPEALAPAQESPATAVAASLNPPFEAIWNAPPKPLPILDDNADLTVELHEFSASISLFLFVLRFPHMPDRVFLCSIMAGHILWRMKGNAQPTSLLPKTLFFPKARITKYGSTGMRNEEQREHPYAEP